MAVDHEPRQKHRYSHKSDIPGGGIPGLTKQMLAYVVETLAALIREQVGFQVRLLR